MLLEKGGELPRDGSTLRVKEVFKEDLFKNHELWVDGYNKQFIPGEYYNVGGKTKWYGAALLRFSPHEFDADEAHQCLRLAVRLRRTRPVVRRGRTAAARQPLR